MPKRQSASFASKSKQVEEVIQLGGILEIQLNSTAAFFVLSQVGALTVLQSEICLNLLFIEGEYGFGLGAGSGFAFADTGQFFYGTYRKLLRFNAIENSFLPCGVIDGN